jgi:hypothetical protein
MLWLLITGCCLTACSGNFFEDDGQRANAPSFFGHELRLSAGERLLENENDVYRPLQGNENDPALRNTAPMLTGSGEPTAAAEENFAPEPPVPSGCSLKDRFDRDAVLAYNFDDNQSRLSLHMATDGASVERVGLRFTYKFQSYKTRKERCRYQSHFQGLGGSIYNEFFLRQHNTVWDNIRDRNAFGLFE